MPYPEKLKKSLRDHLVDEKIINEIYQGYEDIGDKSPKKEKIKFMRHAMNIIDARLTYEQRYEVIDSCACCLGGVREKNVKNFAKSMEEKDFTFEEKIQALKEAHPFENYLTSLDEEGNIRDGIWYEVDGKYKCACTCLSKETLDKPISSTYCLCCAGHFRHHIQNALGIKLKTKEVVSSAIESMEKEPCIFSFEIIKE